MSHKKALFYHIGGKNGKLGEQICDLLPKDTPDVYIEPFGGSFGVAIQSNYDPTNMLIIHNDLDNIVHDIFKAVSQYPKETIDAVYDILDKYEYEQVTVDYIKYVLNYQSLTGENLFKDDIYLGAAAWILKFMTRNGDCKSIKYEKNTIDMMKKLITTFQNRETTALDLKGVLALEMDAFEILNNVKSECGKSNLKVFLYIDAPYSHSGQRTTQHDLYRVDIDKNDNDIVNLANLLQEINELTDCKIMVSEYDNPIYNKILTSDKGWNKTKAAEVHKSMVFVKAGERKPTATEYVWRNYVE